MTIGDSNNRDIAGQNRSYDPALPGDWGAVVPRTIADALDLLAHTAGPSAGGHSSFVFDPSMPGATGPVVFGTFLGAVAAAKAVGDDAATTIYCKLVAGSAFTVPAIAYDTPKNLRLLSLGPEVFGLIFPTGATMTHMPRVLDGILCGSTSTAPVVTLNATIADEITTLELRNGGGVTADIGGGAVPFIDSPVGTDLFVYAKGSVFDQPFGVGAVSTAQDVFLSGSNITIPSGATRGTGSFLVFLDNESSIDTTLQAATCTVTAIGLSSFIYNPNATPVEPHIFNDLTRCLAVLNQQGRAVVDLLLQGGTFAPPAAAYPWPKNVRVWGDQPGDETFFQCGDGVTFTGNLPLEIHSVFFISTKTGADPTPVFQTPGGGELQGLTLYGGDETVIAGSTGAPAPFIDIANGATLPIVLHDNCVLEDRAIEVEAACVGEINALDISQLGPGALRGAGTGILNAGALSLIDPASVQTTTKQISNYAAVSATDNTLQAEAVTGVYDDHGPTVDALTGTTALLSISATVNNPNGGVANANIAVGVTGASAVPAADVNGTNATNQGLSNASLSRAFFRLTGLTPGHNTFSVNYQALANSENFTNRSITYHGP